MASSKEIPVWQKAQEMLNLADGIEQRIVLPHCFGIASIALIMSLFSGSKISVFAADFPNLLSQLFRLASATVWSAKAVLIATLALLPTGSLASAETIRGNGWTMSLSLPAGKGPFPVVIVMPGCSGNSPPAVAAGLRDHARRLTSGGFAAGVINVLGKRSICADAAALWSMEISAARTVIAAANHLVQDKRIDGDRVGFIGQSFGGSVALRIASRKSPFKAIVAYYPWCRNGMGRLRSPTLIMTGRDDTWTPAARCAALGAQIVTYPGAVHSFDLKTLRRQSVGGVGGQYPVAGNAAAATSSQRRYLTFFGQTLRP